MQASGRLRATRVPLITDEPRDDPLATGGQARCALQQHVEVHQAAQQDRYRNRHRTPAGPRLLVKDVLVGPEKITIRHSIPVRHNPAGSSHDSAETDSEGEPEPDCQLRWRSLVTIAGQHRAVGAR